jgi:hypothetical protein
MNHQASVTSLSWIPSEAVTGLNRAVFDTGVGHYDDPPPDAIDLSAPRRSCADLEVLRAADRFRFANHLSATVSVEDGQIVDAAYTGGCLMGSTMVALRSRHATFAAVALPELRQPVELQGSSATFVQTVGGYAGVPAPRRVNHPPFVQLQAPTVWSTLSLTIHADGRSEFELLGASRFPRHWVYDAEGRLAAKAGLTDFKDWWRHSFAHHTPWGDQDSPALVTEVETALEREIATVIMRGGARPAIRKLKPGATLTEQGRPGDEVYLLLDGVLAVEVDGEGLAEVGPGAILGERALLEGGRRTSTLRALTKAKVAVAAADQIDRTVLADIRAGHRRERAE